MAGTPDLFVVCKNCRAEVSPYITECPYCGHRLRKRAPKLEKGAVPRRERRRRPAAPSLPRLRPGELPGIRTDGRPYVTIALVLVAGLASVLWIAGAFDGLKLAMIFGLQGDWWRAVCTHFLFPATNFGSTAYELVTLGTLFLFGWLLERRHGHWAPLLVFAAASAAGVGLAELVDPAPMLLGANAGALGLLAAWAVRDLLTLRSGRDVDADMLGVAVFAALMLLMPAAVPEAHWAAGVGGGIAGLLLGLGLARLRER